MYVVTLPAFQRCLEDGPDAAERGDQREGADSPPAGGLETAISRHITTYRQHRRDPGRQPGVRGSIVPAASRTSYSSFLKVGVRDLFSATEKNKRSRFDSAQPNDTSNTNDLCLECVARSLLKLYRQQQTRFYRFLSLLRSRRGNRAASASVEVVERPPESKRELLHLSPRDTIRYLNRLKESEEAPTLLAFFTGKPLLSGLHQVH